MADDSKPVHTLVLDTGAIIRNEPPISTLIAKANTLITVPAIISEIRDAATRTRFETTIQPFLEIRSPSPNSVKFVTDFARRTGDLAVLSKPDVQIIALTYEIECERNGGDWRLRKTPGQRRVNGAPPVRSAEGAEAADGVATTEGSSEASAETSSAAQMEAGSEATEVELPRSDDPAQPQSGSDAAEAEAPRPDDQGNAAHPSENSAINDSISRLDIKGAAETSLPDAKPPVDSAQNSAESQEDSASDDGEGWITPSNLKKRQAQDAGASTTQAPEPKTMQVGVLTTDFAMQNVILQINLNLLSPSMTRVKHLKTFVLRCHACFQVSKDMTKQFCPKCGQPTLTRVSCSTNANGEFKLHLKKNMQWNTRGDRYSIPKAVHGSANGKLKGGGKGGWGNELILAEDQKEYERASKVEKRQKERSLMDEDYLPGILTGDRGKAGGRVKVGAGRNVNARKR